MYSRIKSYSTGVTIVAVVWDPDLGCHVMFNIQYIIINNTSNNYTLINRSIKSLHSPIFDPSWSIVAPMNVNGLLNISFGLL